MNTARTAFQLTTLLIALFVMTPVSAQSEKPMSVVASFSILGDMVENIGGPHVNVTYLVGPNSDAHVYQPTPADAQAVNQADILFVNGLNFEGWMDRLVEASGFRHSPVVVTSGITPLYFDQGGNGTPDPHAWQNLKNAVIYVDNIAAALAKADPENASAFYRNRAAYVEKIRSIDADIRASINALPQTDRTVVTSHDAFGYFAAEYGLTFFAPQGVSTDSEASAGDVADLIVQIREQAIRAVFVESISDSRLLEQIVAETAASIGGTLYSDALSTSNGPASTYLTMVRHNLETLVTALKN